MNKSEVTQIIRDEIKKFIKDKLDDEVSQLIKRSGNKTHAEIVNMMKNGLEAAFKTFWFKREFWKNDIR